MQTVTKGNSNFLKINLPLLLDDVIILKFSKCGTTPISVITEEIEQDCIGVVTFSVLDFCNFCTGIWELEIIQNNEVIHTENIKVNNGEHLRIGCS